MYPEDILCEADMLMNGSREETYGNIKDNWTRIGIMWGAILETEPIEPNVVGLMMASLKISRAVSNPNHRDNYIDGCAYMAGAGDIVSRN